MSGREGVPATRSSGPPQFPEGYSRPPRSSASRSGKDGNSAEMSKRGGIKGKETPLPRVAMLGHKQNPTGASGTNLLKTVNAVEAPQMEIKGDSLVFEGLTKDKADLAKTPNIPEDDLGFTALPLNRPSFFLDDRSSVGGGTTPAQTSLLGIDGHTSSQEEKPTGSWSTKKESPV